MERNRDPNGPRLTLEIRRLARRREKLEADLGEEGLLEERWNSLGLLGAVLLFFGMGAGAVLHWSFGLSGAEAEVAVRHRRLELETGWDWSRGVEGVEKNPNLDDILGLLLVLLLLLLLLV